ncbi:MAG: OOP family OmpA-OmpF porin [Halieaceae bacterium]|jgi:OOP family OmpA-OmpF porin
MNAPLRLFVLLAVGLLSACSSLSDRQYEACIIGFSALGGAVGAISSGSGTLPGIAVGAGVSAVVCGPAEEPEVVAMAAPADSDGDGIADDADRCPGTPTGVEVDTKGCPLDGDGDGVADYLDRCPGTPAGIDVDEHGCPVKDEVMLTIDRLGFAFDSAELDAGSKAALGAAVDLIKSHSSVKMDVIGYTDTSGPESYNQGLSERRAKAAVAYLVSRGVDADQLRAVGRGEADPVASNDTRDGRSQNRRVEMVVR